MEDKKKKEQSPVELFSVWTLTFTKKIVLLCTIVWIMCTCYSAVAIMFAIIRVGDFSYLDTFINDYGESFRLIVGVNLISKTFENIWRYNDGGIFGTNNGLYEKEKGGPDDIDKQV